MLKLKKWFHSSGSADAEPALSSSTSEKLRETLMKMEKKESILQSKISVENERAKECTRSRNNKGKIQCLKRKAFYESQLEQLQNIQLQVNDQMKMFKGVSMVTKV
ncbi:hypothetical protein Syun_030202 [Stephania yunnanensis]|uniref:Uncharacterized protein n=1 Tax=Stephania yunnanensis TaxID=152371 RepID=A0AAP0HGS7_9MAGN